MIPKRKVRRGFTLIELMIVVAIVGILAVLAVFGVRRYLSNAKSAEASNSLGMLNQGAVAAYEQETTPAELIGPGKSSTTSLHSLCAAVTAAVPAKIASVKGVKYVADNGAGNDYAKDGNVVAPTGFACLRFEINQPQFYQYEYNPGAGGGKADGRPAGANTPKWVATSWEVAAYGDLNGDGRTSAFITGGDTLSGRAITVTTIDTTDPEE